MGHVQLALYLQDLLKPLLYVMSLPFDGGMLLCEPRFYWLNDTRQRPGPNGKLTLSGNLPPHGKPEGSPKENGYLQRMV